MELPADLRRDPPVRLEGAGLVLREWCAADVPQMVELFDDPLIARFTPLPSPFTLADAEQRFVRGQQGDRLLLAITTDGEQPLGEVLLTAGGELGYAIGPEHRGQGLAARALGLLRDHALGDVGLTALRLRIEPGNAASATIATQAGFRLTHPAYETVENKGRTVTIDLWELVAGSPSVIAVTPRAVDPGAA